MGESVPHVRKTKRRPSITRRAKIAAAICFGLAAVLVFGGLYLKQQETIQANAEAAAQFQAAPLTDVSAPPSRSIGILSDSHANNADSWWRQTVAASAVPGLDMAAFESQPGAETTSLLPRLDAAAADAEMVVVQAGTNDLLAGKTAAEAASGAFALWDGVEERDAQPIAALVPPSDDRPADAAELNRLIREEAQRRGIDIIDVYTPVAADDGSWAAGMTEDGVHSNRAGSDLMAAAAQEQLLALR